MSIRQARLFIQRVQMDDCFRERVLAEEDVEARMKLIRSEGYDCTAEEIAGVLVALSDAMLDAVEGGGGAQPRFGPSSGQGSGIYHPN